LTGEVSRYSCAGKQGFAIEVGEMEEQFLRPNEERRLNVKLLSEIDNVVQRAREALAPSPRRLLKLPYAPNDLREQARLCMEEAEATTETAVCRAFASRALLLAQVAEVIAARLNDKPAPEQCRPDDAVINAAA
jgi:hypothetical protein